MLTIEQQLTAFSLISWLQQSQATLPPKPAAIIAQWMQEVRETVGKDTDAEQANAHSQQLHESQPEAGYPGYATPDAVWGRNAEVST